LPKSNRNYGSLFIHTSHECCTGLNVDHILWSCLSIALNHSHLYLDYLKCWKIRVTPIFQHSWLFILFLFYLKWSLIFQSPYFKLFLGCRFSDVFSMLLPKVYTPLDKILLELSFSFYSFAITSHCISS